MWIINRDNRILEENGKDWGERLQDEINQPKFERPRIGINPTPKSDKPNFPTRECKPPNVKSGIPSKEDNNLSLLNELLNNPRVEGITINIEKVGQVEKININAKLKENPTFLELDISKIPDGDKEEFLKHMNSKSTISFE